MAVLFITGSVPGCPEQIGHILVLGAASNDSLLQEQNNLDFVSS